MQYLNENQQHYINEFIHRYNKLGQMTKDYAAMPFKVRKESLLGKSVITSIENNLIAYIHNQPDMNMTELSRKLFMKKSNLTKLVDKMEQKELIFRIPNPTDRRSYRLQITEQTEKDFNHSHLLAAKTYYDNLMLLTTEAEREKMLECYNFILEVFERIEKYEQTITNPSDEELEELTAATKTQ